MCLKPTHTAWWFPRTGNVSDTWGSLVCLLRANVLWEALVHVSDLPRKLLVSLRRRKANNSRLGDLWGNCDFQQQIK